MEVIVCTHIRVHAGETTLKKPTRNSRPAWCVRDPDRPGPGRLDV
jgi:hypothetical protein